jgi:hypothetical protein
LKFKIKNTAKYTEKKQKFVGWEKEVKYMRICETLIDRIQNEYYQMEYQDYRDLEMKTVPTEDGLYKVVFDVKRDDTEQFVKKYSHALRRAKKTQDLRVILRVIEMVVLQLVLSDMKKRENFCLKS